MTNILGAKDGNGKAFKGYAVGRGDFPEFDGKIIDYTYGGPEEKRGTTKVIVIGCNRAVGCTMVNVADKDDYFMCLRGPVMPRGGHSGRYVSYNDMFDDLVQAIADGEYFTDIMNNHELNFPGGGGSPSGSGCAFSQ